MSVTYCEGTALFCRDVPDKNKVFASFKENVRVFIVCVVCNANVDSNLAHMVIVFNNLIYRVRYLIKHIHVCTILFPNTIAIQINSRPTENGKYIYSYFHK